MSPNYDYRCPNCEQREVIHHDFHDESPRLCSVCKAVMRKAFQPTPAIFRGTGWGGQK